jgi:hypothetical protein
MPTLKKLNEAYCQSRENLEKELKDALQRKFKGPNGEIEFANRWKELYKENKLDQKPDPKIEDLAIQDCIKFELCQASSRKASQKSVFGDHLQDEGVTLLLKWAKVVNVDSRCDYRLQIAINCCNRLLQILKSHGRVKDETPESRRQDHLKLTKDLTAIVLDAVRDKAVQNLERSQGIKDALAYAFKQIKCKPELETDWRNWDIPALSKLEQVLNDQSTNPFEFLELKTDLGELQWDNIIHIRNKSSHEVVPWDNAEMAALACLDFLEQKSFESHHEDAFKKAREVLGEDFYRKEMSMKGSLIIAGAIIIFAVAIIITAVIFVFGPQYMGGTGPQPSQPIPAPTSANTSTPTTTPTPKPSPRAPWSAPPTGFEDVVRDWVYTSGSVRFDRKATLHWTDCEWANKISPQNRTQIKQTRARDVYDTFTDDGIVCTWCSTCQMAEPLQ